jgi:hypothetical protein
MLSDRYTSNHSLELLQGREALARMESRVHFRHVGDSKITRRCKMGRNDRATETLVTAPWATSSMRVQAAQRDGPEVTRRRTRGSNAERGVVSQPVIIEVNRGRGGGLGYGTSFECLKCQMSGTLGEWGQALKLERESEWDCGSCWAQECLGKAAVHSRGCWSPDRSASLF